MRVEILRMAWYTVVGAGGHDERCSAEAGRRLDLPDDVASVLIADGAARSLELPATMTLASFRTVRPLQFEGRAFGVGRYVEFPLEDEQVSDMASAGWIVRESPPPPPPPDPPPGLVMVAARQGIDRGFGHVAGAGTVLWMGGAEIAALGPLVTRLSLRELTESEEAFSAFAKDNRR